MSISRAVVVLLAFAAAAAAAAGCAVGDAPYFCQALGGEYQDLPSPPLLPACRVYYNHNGTDRYVHIYLPPSFDGSTTFSIWIHLHGVFWAAMGDAGKMAGRPINATDVIPKWDRTIERLGSQVIFVYPQSGGYAGTGDESVEGQGDKYRQFWHIPFWPCSVGICSDPSLDDVGFLEQVVADLPARLPLQMGKYYLSGESAGGMMVHTLLCQSDSVARAINAAADMLGGIGTQYAASSACTPPHTAPVPFIKLQGRDDPTIPFVQPLGAPVLVDGVEFLGAVDATAVRARQNGCGPDAAGPEVSEAGGLMSCTDLCAMTEPGAPAAKVCGVLGVGHETDHPYPGFVYDQAWAFFQQQQWSASLDTNYTAAAAGGGTGAEAAQGVAATAPGGGQPVEAAGAEAAALPGAEASQAAAAAGADNVPATATSGAKAAPMDWLAGGTFSTGLLVGAVVGGAVATFVVLGAAGVWAFVRWRRQRYEQLAQYPPLGAERHSKAKGSGLDMVMLAGGQPSSAPVRF